MDSRGLPSPETVCFSSILKDAFCGMCTLGLTVLVLQDCKRFVPLPSGLRCSDEKARTPVVPSRSCVASVWPQSGFSFVFSV